MANKVIQRIDGVLKHINIVQKEINGVSFDDFKKQTTLPDAIHLTKEHWKDVNS